MFLMLLIMKSDQVWWRPAGGAAAARRRARAINTRRPRPRPHGNTRSPPKIGGKTRMRAAHDKCHCETAQQVSALAENREKQTKVQPQQLYGDCSVFIVPLGFVQWWNRTEIREDLCKKWVSIDGCAERFRVSRKPIEIGLTFRFPLLDGALGPTLSDEIVKL